VNSVVIPLWPMPRRWSMNNNITLRSNPQAFNGPLKRVTPTSHDTLPFVTSIRSSRPGRMPRASHFISISAWGSS